jgi:hypothetical protein
MWDVMGVGEKTEVLTNKGVTTIVAKHIIKKVFPKMKTVKINSSQLQGI